MGQSGGRVSNTEAVVAALLWGETLPLDDCDVAVLMAMMAMGERRCLVS
ncbi:MAG: hypothetical protein ACI9R3_002217 [Verrucomicrobiales bacterium]|jgi:hypothetical protein